MIKPAVNVPQWVIDIFNKIDFKKIDSVNKNLAIGFLTTWANHNLLLANPRKPYPQKPKKVNINFDEDLMRLLNKYDYDGVNITQKTLLKMNLGKWKKEYSIPVDKNVRTIQS